MPETSLNYCIGSIADIGGRMKALSDFFDADMQDCIRDKPEEALWGGEIIPRDIWGVETLRRIIVGLIEDLSLSAESCLGEHWSEPEDAKRVLFDLQKNFVDQSEETSQEQANLANRGIHKWLRRIADHAGEYDGSTEERRLTEERYRSRNGEPEPSRRRRKEWVH